MDQKKYRKHMFFTAAVLTAVVFLSGMLLGWGLDRYRTKNIFEDLRQNELDAESYIVEQQFFNAMPNATCDIAKTRIDALSIDLGEIGRTLAGFSGKSIFEKNDYDYLTRKYFLMEIKTYLLFGEFLEQCPSNGTRILYFYRIDDRESLNQGYAIDEIVLKNNDVKVFSFDIEYDKDPLIKSMKKYYNITDAPTIIVDGEVKREGYVGVTALKPLVGQ